MKRLFLIITFCTFLLSAYAQNNFCASSKSNPAFFQYQNTKIRETSMNRLAYEYLSKGITNNRNASVPLIIPVVFHVIHQNGPENVADSVLQTEIDMLNARFSNTAPFNYPGGVDINIQFCLASVDPYGNPTTGITHDTSVYSIIPPSGDVAMKNVNRWNPYRYLNVWIVKDCVMAMGFSAYSSYPWWKGTPVDGIVIQAASVGSIYPYFLLSHEVGHYLGLYHVDEGDSCVNFNCLLDGDNVCDTPPEYHPADCNISSCSTDMDDTSGANPFTTDMIDISNLMLPIVGCPYLFTPGQSDRMNYFLTTGRSELLTSNGCGQHPSSGTWPVADFIVDASSCSGFKFVSTSTDAEYLEWDFNNDGYFEAIGDTVYHSFSTQGNVKVVLRAFNAVGFDTDTMEIYVFATNNTLFPISSVTTNNQSNNGNFFCSGAVITLTAVPGMAQYNWSTGDTTQTITIVADSAISISLTCIDSSGFTWQKCPDPYFSWGIIPSPDPVTLHINSDDTLCINQPFEVSFTLQPGTFLHQILSDGFPGISQDTNITLNYYNQFNNYIAVVVWNNNYCAGYSDTVHVVFSPPVPGPLFPGVNGNLVFANDPSLNYQWYLDGIAIPGANSDTLLMTSNGCYNYAAWTLDSDCATLSQDYCNTSLGINDDESAGDLHIYPNPAHDRFHLKMNNIKSILLQEKLHCYDAIGRELNLSMKNISNDEVEISTENVPSGLYILRLKDFGIRLMVW